MNKNARVAQRDKIKKNETFFEVDAQNWRQSEFLSLEDLEYILDTSSNVKLCEFSNQDTEPTLPPGSYAIETKLELAADDNFLYVWNISKKRWKRIPLSDF